MSDKTRCVELSLREVRRLPPIVSDYQTWSVYRVRRDLAAQGAAWVLEEEGLETPMRKVYDTGHIDHILSSYSPTKEENLHFAGAFQGGDFVGLAIWTGTAWNNSLWLMDIRVRDGSRGQGVGGALLDHIVGFARDEGWRGILVETQNNNYPAIRFYRRHGFEFVGLNDHLYSNEDLARQDVAVYLYYAVHSGNG